MGELKIPGAAQPGTNRFWARASTSREFHSQILKDGAMPLDILEAKIKLWMEARPLMQPVHNNRQAAIFIEQRESLGVRLSSAPNHSASLYCA